MTFDSMYTFGCDFDNSTTTNSIITDSTTTDSTMTTTSDHNTPTAMTSTVDSTSNATIEDPVHSMFARFQQRSTHIGVKRISYSREYKLAAIQCVKSGKTR